MFLGFLIFSLFTSASDSLRDQAVDLCRRHVDERGLPFYQGFKKHCDQLETTPQCLSVQSRPIYWIDYLADERNRALARKILAVAVVHGDEPESLWVIYDWSLRLKSIEGVRNHWRFVPVLNPDGLEAGSRVNAHSVDLNRNFPTQDWEKLALLHWEKTGRQVRRYPGSAPGSEPEVKCLVQMIEDWEPDLVVAIHTPLGLLDFDGPDIRPSPKLFLPWRRLGHFPGSLGRFMWHERGKPVLTVELPKSYRPSRESLAVLQDFIGTIAWEKGRFSPK